MIVRLTARLSIALSDGEPPDEIRFFKHGWNSTQKGDFLFDDVAARSVMQAFNTHGVEQMIDLEHLSLDPDSPNYDPNARAWYVLEVRNGDLFAVKVRWTDDGAERLKKRTQRYISPFFDYDRKTKRVLAVFNAALCAVPATNDTPALIAASLRASKKHGSLNSEVKDMDKICQALGLKEDATAEDVLGAIKALTDQGGDSDEVMKKLRSALKLADDASMDDCMSALTKLTGDDAPPTKADKDGELAKDSDGDYDGDKEGLSALRKSNPRLYGELIALRANTKTFDDRIKAIEKLTGQAAVEKLIADNTDKIPLHLEAWAKSQSIETLSGFLKHAQPSRRAAARDPEKKTVDDPANAELGEADKHIAKLSGVPEKIVLEERKRELQEKKDRMTRQH